MMRVASVLGLAVAGGLSLAVAGLSQAQELTGLDIAKRADDVARSKTEHQTMTMILENSRGQQRVRTIDGWGREVSEAEDHRFARFLEPADVKDTTLLTYDYDEKDDDIWLYLPALKKVKRILSSNKTDYFMGSDFTYEDMENMDLVNWTYTLKGEEAVDGVDCYIVESVPNNEREAAESGYVKKTAWIGKQDFVSRKAEFTDKKDRVSKRLVATDVRPVGTIAPKPRAHTLTMENFTTEHKTVLQFKDIALDVPVDEKVFSQRNLTQ